MADDGGSAFPMVAHPDIHGGYQPTMYGMSLRDWFAGQALVGMIAGMRMEGVEYAAHRVYAVADAMLAERVKTR